MMWFGSKQNQENYWKPGIQFLRSQGTQFPLPNGVVLPLTWKFVEIGAGRLPFHYIQCKLKTRGLETVGQGCALSIVQAMRKALAEAWERLWLYLPQEFPELPYPNSTSSNGFAAGPTAVDALAFAREELIERAVVLTAWQSMRGWQPVISPRSLTFRLLSSALRSEGWTTHLFRIEEKTFGSVLAALLSHPEKGFAFDSKTVGAGSYKTCETKLIHSLLRVKYGHDGQKRSFELPESGYPEDQSRFYENPDMTDAFTFLDRSESQSGIIELPSPQLIQQQILCDPSSLPAVAVASHGEWPVLTWGKESIAGKNPWPHPLA